MAKFDPCPALPQPAATQNVVLSVNRFGCFYRAKNSWAKRFPGPRLACDAFPVPGLYGELNWRRFRLVARRWTQILTASQRLAWDTLAGLVPYKNYLGSTGFANGWGLFLKMNHLNFLHSLPQKNNPPGAWNALEVPTVVSWSLLPGNDLQVKYPAAFNPPPELSGGTVITREPKVSSRYPMHYTNTSLLTWGFDGTNWVTDVDVSCPFFRNQQGREFTVGIYHIHTGSSQFTDFFWMRVG